MNVLILGAGLMQKPAILSAKELGYKVCVIDADDKAVAIQYADEFRKIDLKDKENILSYAKELKTSKDGLAGVFTAGTDFSSSVSYVCQNLNLPSHSYLASCNASIKTQMRQCFLDNGIPSPKFLKISGPELSDSDISKIKETLTFPLVVKPVDNMGARGCRMVRSQKELLPSLKLALSSSRSANVIVEEYMQGEEYSIDALIYKNTFTVTGFALRHIKYPPYFIETGHTMPADLDKNTHDQLISVFALASKSLGLSCGAAKADIKFTKNGPMIGEIAGRLSGGYMSGWTFPYASDLNLTKEALKIACGNEPSELIKQRKSVDYQPSLLCKGFEKPYELFEVTCKRTSAERAWISIPGKVEYIENITEYTDKAVFDTLPRATVKISSQVDFPRNNVEKCGNIIAVSHNRDIAIKAAEDAVSNVFITLQSKNKVTDDFLNYKENDDEEGFPPSAFGKLNQDDLEKISGIIPPNKKVEDYIPEILKTSEYLNIKDWNYNTILDTARKFDTLRKKHPALEAKKFWSGILRGGLQAAVYISDSV